MSTEQVPDSIPVVKKKPLWVKILLSFGVAFIAIPVIALTAAWLLEGKIKAKIVDGINKEVTVPVQVNGKIGFSLLRHFPYASLSLEKVVIGDKLRKGEQLLNVGEFSFLFNILSLFGKDMEVSKVLVRDGEINMYKNEAGKVNYDIIKTSNSTSPNSLSVQLKKAEIKKVRFTYNDKVQSTYINVQIADAQVSGNFSDAAFDLQTKSKMTVNRISVNGEEFMANRKVRAELTLEVDKANKKYSFKDGKIIIEETEFGLSGYFAALKESTKIDFKLLSAGKDIRKLFSLLPEKYKQQLSNAEGSGEYSITASIKGVAGRNSSPAVSVSATLKNSEVKLDKFNKFLKNVNAIASYTIDEHGNDKLDISNFNCTLNDLPFNFKLSLANLSNPTFDFYANGVLHLSELSSFIPDTVMQDLDGAITFDKFHLGGKKDDFSNVENTTLTGSGEFKMSGIEFRQNGITYGNINGLLKYEGDVIEAEGFTLNFLSTDFSFTGNIKNLFAFAYNLSEKRSANNIVLGVNGKIKTKTLNLSGILDAFNKKNRPQAQLKQKINVREIFNMMGNVDIDIENFIFREMRFEQLIGNLQVAPADIRINHLSTHTMGGDLRAKGEVLFTPDNSLRLICDLSAIELDIPKIFLQCENFGQTVLTNKNLKGTVSTGINMDITWLNYKEMDERTLSAVVDFSIKNGELIKFEPIKAASKFINVKELEDIRFAGLSNTIKISGRRIDIPEFEIKSSALNLILFGHHYFDNQVDYHFKINLHKVLSQKFRRSNNAVQYIEDDPYEGLNLYLSMTGPLSDPTIKFDKASSRNKIKEDFKKERVEMKNLLKGNAVKTNTSDSKREDKYFDTKEQPGFIDFEEEEKKNN